MTNPSFLAAMFQALSLTACGDDPSEGSIGDCVQGDVEVDDGTPGDVTTTVAVE
jgi:hypothetical protein